MIKNDKRKWCKQVLKAYTFGKEQYPFTKGRHKP